MGIFAKDRDLSAALERVELSVRASDFRARADELSLRLDRFLQHHLSWRSRNSIQTLIRDGWVSVAATEPERDGALGATRVERRASRRLTDGALVLVEIPPELRPARTEGASDELDVLHEDDELLVVDKPPGLPVHPSGRHLTDTLIQRVHARAAAGGEPPTWWPKLCHRLDLETSGIVLVAKDRASHARLMAQFEDREVDKEYLAVVRGVPDTDGGTIELPLGPARTSEIRLKMAALADGLPARTDWKLLRRGRDRALVACRLHTGRQHQIRVHLDAIGHPLVGDKLYGVDESVFLRHARGELTEADRALLALPRHALHNHRLAFTSPRTGERHEVVSPLPDDLARCLED